MEDASRNAGNRPFATVNVNLPDLGIKKLGPAIGRSLDRLSGAVADALGIVKGPAQTTLQAIADRFAERQEAKSKAETLEALTATIEGLPLPKTAQKDAIRYLLTRSLLDQDNREAVARLAYNHVEREARRLPEPSKASQARDIEDDWLTLFWRCAAEKSHPDLQDIFARILAREAFEPGVIAPATLHTLSILDAQTARSVEKLCNISFRNVATGECYLLEPDAMRVVARGDAPDLYEFGISHEDLEMADQLGITSRTNNICFDPDDDGAHIELGAGSFA